MSKAATIRLLHAERCSVPEIAAALHWPACDVRRFIRLWLEDIR